MSLEDIQLPSIVLKDLFKFSLVDLTAVSSAPPIPASKGFLTLGNNLKNIVIIVENEKSLYLPDEQLNFLLGILSACNLHMEDVAILNTRQNESVNYKTISGELHPEKLFLFGITPAQIELPLDFPNYQIQQFNNQVYLSAPVLSDFHDNKAKKTKLWNCLKQIFDL